MAARFDASTAAELGQTSGDGTPIHLTIPTDDPWVPIRILALGLDRSQVVDADVFLLTDERPQLATAGPGLRLERSEAASDSLMADLASDAGMEWMPSDMWLTYLRLQAPAGDLDYDLAVSAETNRAPSPRDTGAARYGFEVGRVDNGGTSTSVPWLAISVALVAVAALTGAVSASARRS